MLHDRHVVPVERVDHPDRAPRAPLDQADRRVLPGLGAQPVDDRDDAAAFAELRVVQMLGQPEAVGGQGAAGGREGAQKTVRDQGSASPGTRRAGIRPDGPRLLAARDARAVQRATLSSSGPLTR